MLFLPAPPGRTWRWASASPNLTFSGTLSAEDRAYLGLTRPGPFTLKDIQARYVLLEIFSDSCPHCMLAAPGVNRLFRLIEGNPEIAGR